MELRNGYQQKTKEEIMKKMKKIIHIGRPGTYTWCGLKSKNLEYKPASKIQGVTCKRCMASFNATYHTQS
jgi:hypothetical protein